MPQPAFATPLPQSTRSEVLEWRFPKPHGQYVLTGRSRAAWHTSFVIPQLNLLLDAGLCVNKLRPKHVFLTHGHSDHTALSFVFVKRDDPPDIFCPAEMKKVFDDFILANTMLNLGGLFTADDAPQSGPESDGEGSDSVENHQLQKRNNNAWLNTHVTHGIHSGDVVPLRRLKNISAMAFDCDHTVPCLGYVFSATSQRLKPEYASLSGPELKNLRQSGAQITAPHNAPIFAFLGDTTAATLASGPSWLQGGIPVVITECSFLYDEHKPQADKTKHTIWCDLEKVVRKWPKTTFVLTHFSLRYNDEEIRRFFKNLPDPPGNIVIWIDGEDEMVAS
jgi:ribonuclease Z